MQLEKTMFTHQRTEKNMTWDFKLGNVYELVFIYMNNGIKHSCFEQLFIHHISNPTTQAYDSFGNSILKEFLSNLKNAKLRLKFVCDLKKIDAVLTAIRSIHSLQSFCVIANDAANMAASSIFFPVFSYKGRKSHCKDVIWLFSGCCDWKELSQLSTCGQSCISCIFMVYFIVDCCVLGFWA